MNVNALAELGRSLQDRDDRRIVGVAGPDLIAARLADVDGAAGRVDLVLVVAGSGRQAEKDGALRQRGDERFLVQRAEV